MDLHSHLMRECRIVYAAPKKLFAPLDGLVSLNVDEGQSVATGALLATYDTAAPRRNLKEALSRQETLRQRIAQVKGPLQQARLRLMDLESAQIDRDIATARETLDLAEDLAEEGKLAANRLEESVEALARLMDQRTAADQKRAVFRIETALQLADLEHDALRVQLLIEDLQDTIERSTIESPEPGVVSEISPRLLEGDNVAMRAGTHMFTIANPGRLGARIALTEDEAEMVRDADIIVSARPDRQADARLVRLTRDETGRTWEKEDFEALVSFDDGAAHWAVGQDARCTFSKPAARAAIAVPVSAVSRLGEKLFVTRLTDDGAEQVEIRTGVADPPFVQVLSGLAAGDRIAAE